MKEEIVWIDLQAPSCPRRKCFIEGIDRVHEYRSGGSAATGIGGEQNEPHLPVVSRRVFKMCRQRRYGCPKKYRA